MKPIMQLSAALLLIVSISVSARSVEYSPDSVARLGYGFNPNAPLDIYAVPCIASEGEENIDTSNADPSSDNIGTPSGNIRISEISDRRSLLNSVGISASIEASSGIYSGSTSFSREVSVTFESTSLIWVASTTINFGRWRLKNPVAAKPLIDAPTPADVVRICGSEIYTQQTKGVVAAIIFELRGLNSEQKQKVSTALHAAASGPGPNGSADAAFKTILEETQKTSQLNVSVHVQGGPGKKFLAAVSESPSDIIVLRKSLSNYISTSNPKNARPLEYQTSPITQFKPITISAPPNLAQDRLWDIYQHYINLTLLVQRINELTKPTTAEDNFLRQFVSEKKRADLAKVGAVYDQYRSKLRDAGLKCLSGKEDCSVPSVADLPRIEWPDIPPAPYASAVYFCDMPLAAVVGSPPPPKGSTVGYVSYKVAIIGDQNLFKSVQLIAPDSTVPLTLKTEYNLSADEKSQIKMFETCGSSSSENRRTVRQENLIGYVYVIENLEQGIPFDYRIEVQEKLGRRTYYDLKPF